MRKIIYLVIFVLMLSGCTKLNNKTENLLADTNMNNLYYDNAVTEDGIYFALPNNIAYMDMKTKERILLCNRIECTHKDETCTSYTQSMANAMFTNLKKDKLFFCYNFDYIDKIFMCELSGDNREEIFASEAYQTIPHNFIFDDENLYFVVLEHTVEGTESKIIQLNYITKQYNEIYSAPKDIRLATGYDSNLIFYLFEYGEDTQQSSFFSNGSVKIVNYDLTENSEKLICEFDISPTGQKEGYIVKNNILLKFTRNDEDSYLATVEKINLQTEESQILTTEFPFFGTFFQDNFQMITDDEVYIYEMQPYSENSEYKYGYYKLNISNGEFSEVTMMYRNVLIEDASSVSEYDLTAYNEYFEQRKKFIPMVATGQIDDYYVARTAITTYITVDTENLGTYSPYGYDVIELIKKQDFIQSKENFFRIR